ncbi:MAG: hypothetical protein JKY50_10960 [Oleispira sp.]|nr:hypothetical protein [Oleispira sp.]MBL4880591.1 hypothetical protein [Oleispira sp.]
MMQYENLFREKFLETLGKNGYINGYDFELASVTVQESTGYSVPRVVGVLSYEGDVIYIPQGVQFESIYELSMKLLEGGMEFSERDRGASLRYWAEPDYGSDYDSKDSEEAVIVKKGPYPGVGYFADELDAIQQSLLKHRPVLVIDERFNEKINLADVVFEKSPNIYQVSEEVVQIAFVYDASSQINFGFKFHYNLKSGAVSIVSRMSPPSFM